MLRLFPAELPDIPVTCAIQKYLMGPSVQAEAAALAAVAHGAGKEHAAGCAD